MKIDQAAPPYFEAQVARHPAHLAIKTHTSGLTYQGLNEAANRLAHAILRRCGARPEPVALLLDGDISSVVAILAALKAGKCYVPIDAATPPARIAYILADSGAALVVTESRRLDRMAALGVDSENRYEGQTLCMDRLDDDLPLENPNLAIAPDALAQIIYTSGSTGRPKGVVHTQRNCLHGIIHPTSDTAITADDRYAYVGSWNFGASRAAILGSLLHGATLLPYDIKTQGVSQLASWLVQEEITIYQSTATTFRHLAATLTGAETFPRLRLIKLGGEAVYKADVEAYKKHFSEHCLLRVSLAATETYRICAHFIDKNTPIDSHVAPVGYPLPGKEVLLLDSAGAAVAPGQIGEIAVRSNYLSLGYWRQPALTAARFRPDPQGGGKRIHLTGDLGRRRADGRLEHLSRQDSQVKIRGFRVELSAIEGALLSLDAVQEAAVVAEDRPSGEKRLVAYLAPSGRAAPTVSTLRSALAQTLPDYMLPAVFVILDALPQTATGKVDRQALPAPGAARPELEAVYESPRTPLERRLAVIWAETLGVAPVGVHDNFFDLGGNSLLGARLFACIEETLGQRVSLALLFRYPTVAQLAQALSPAAMVSDGWEVVVPIQPDGSRPPFFCVHGFGGGVLGYAHLARLMGQEQPFYGLQAVGLDGEQQPDQTIEEMAARYVAAMRAVQPAGPYRVGGYCFGGVVAFEMARRLEAQGEMAALVALFEGYAPDVYGERPLLPRSARLLAVWRNLPFWAQDYWQLGYQGLRVRVRQKTSRVGKRLQQRLGRSAEIAPQDIVSDDLSVVPEHHRRLLELHLGAMHRYAPTPYSGRVTVFRARGLTVSRALFGSLDPQLGWGPLAAGVEVREVEGGHRNIHLPPYVSSLAEQLGRALDETEPKRP